MTSYAVPIAYYQYILEKDEATDISHLWAKQSSCHGGPARQKNMQTKLFCVGVVGRHVAIIA